MEITINGARLHYERAGSGMPLFLLHAGIADSRMWQAQVEAFSKDFDVIAPDQRGFGHSELPARRWSEVADLLAIMDALELKPSHVVGCSYGSSLAMDFALDHPERVSRVVLVGPSINGAELGKKYPEVFAEVRAAEEAHDLVALNNAEMKLFLVGPTRSLDKIDERLRDLFLDMNGRNLEVDWGSAPTDDLNPPAFARLGEIRAPTLVIVGDADIPPVLEAAEILVTSVPGARKAVIHDAAHLPNLEHPEQFNRLVLDFLKS